MFQAVWKKKFFSLPLIEKGRLCGLKATGKKIPLLVSPLLALEDGVPEVRYSQCYRVCLSLNVLHSLPVGNSRYYLHLRLKMPLL